MEVFSSRRDRWRAALGLLVVVLAFVGLYVALQRYAPFVFDDEELRNWIDQFGALAPLVFVVIQAVQVVVAPIPGQVVALVAGYLFGSIAGTVYSLVGVLIGSAIAFLLAKRYGRSFVEDILDEDVVKRFDGFVDRVGIAGLIAFVLVPGLPDDVICFFAGLTQWSLKTFMIVITIGRLPAYVITVYAGGQFASGQFLSALALVGIVISLSLFGLRNQEQIQQLVQRLEPKLPF
ncbi:hypothetical protein GCM10028857_27270 [Salinarchaeum chitinilyticum]